MYIALHSYCMTATVSEQIYEKVAYVKDKERYSNLGDAFSHWYLVEKFGLSNSEAMDACRIAGAGDKGLDAYFLSDGDHGVQ